MTIEENNLKNINRLDGVHPDLVKVVKETAKRLFGTHKRKLLVIEGVRTPEEQAARYAKGRTAPGPIVTNSLKSKHLKQKDGFGYAVDIALTNLKGGIDWNDLASFEEVRATMLKVAKELGVKNLRSGADWDRNNIPDYKEVIDYKHKFGHRPLVDYPHYELL